MVLKVVNNSSRDITSNSRAISIWILRMEMPYVLSRSMLSDLFCRIKRLFYEPYNYS